MWYKCIWFIIVISTSSCSLRESLGESPINHHSSIIQAIEDTRHIKPLLMIIMAIHNLKLAHKLQINCHPINHSSVSLFRSLNAIYMLVASIVCRLIMWSLCPSSCARCAYIVHSAQFRSICVVSGFFLLFSSRCSWDRIFIHTMMHRHMLFNNNEKNPMLEQEIGECIENYDTCVCYVYHCDTSNVA